MKEDHPHHQPSKKDDSVIYTFKIVFEKSFKFFSGPTNRYTMEKTKKQTMTSKNKTNFCPTTSIHMVWCVCGGVVPQNIEGKKKKKSSLAGNRTRGGRVKADRVTDYTTREFVKKKTKKNCSVGGWVFDDLLQNEIGC